MLPQFQLQCVYVVAVFVLDRVRSLLGVVLGVCCPHPPPAHPPLTPGAEADARWA